MMKLWYKAAIIAVLSLVVSFSLTGTADIRAAMVDGGDREMSTEAEDSFSDEDETAADQQPEDTQTETSGNPLFALPVLSDKQQEDPLFQTLADDSFPVELETAMGGHLSLNSNGLPGCTFSSSDPSVATVDELGEVEALGQGTTIITTTVFTRVYETLITVTGPTLLMSEFSLTEGECVTNRLEGLAPNHELLKVTYASDNPMVASVTKDGLVRALAPGDTTIRVKVGNVRLSFDVYVNTTKTEYEYPYDTFLDVCERLATKIVEDNDWPWVYSPRGRTWEDAQKYHETSCANFVSLCMQEYGTLPVGNTLYCHNDTENRAGELVYQGTKAQKAATAKAIRENYTYLNMKGCHLSKCRLKAGDILGFYKGETQHMAVFAGYNQKGETTWYDFGSDGTSGKTSKQRHNDKPFVRVKKTGGNTWGKVSFILRLKESAEERITQKQLEEAENKVKNASGIGDVDVWFGDSRFVGMGSDMKVSDDCVAKVAAGYEWASGEGYKKLTKKLDEVIREKDKENKKAEKNKKVQTKAKNVIKNTTGEDEQEEQIRDICLVTNFGINDPVNYKKYVALYAKLHQKYPRVQIYAMSVNPVGSRYRGPVSYKKLNAMAETFNDYLFEHIYDFDGCYIDTYNNVKFSYARDNLHFDKTCHKAIYNYVTGR